jgi:hypothetical protein
VQNEKLTLEIKGLKESMITMTSELELKWFVVKQLENNIQLEES